MAIQQIIENLKLNPKQLFLLDGCGAILSAFLLGVVLVKLEKYFGIPSSTLYFLASLPVGFAVYDFYCYRKQNRKLAGFLKVIGILNLLYCVVSILGAFYHAQTITSLGWIYIVTEILIVASMATVELKIYSEIFSTTESPQSAMD